MDLYAVRSRNKRMTAVLMVVFVMLLGAVGWVVENILGFSGFFHFAIIFALAMNLFAWWKSDSLVLKMHRAKPVTREENPELWNLVENLSIAGGIKMPRIYIMDESAPNAFATGRNEGKGVVVFTRGLLELLDKSELEGVAAHELSHIKNRDILVGTIASVLAGVFMMLADMLWRASFWGGRDDDGGGWIKVVGLLVVMVAAPLGASLLRMAVSRKREFMADSTGALITRYPEGLASALVKISNNAMPLRTASSSTSHLFISNPFAGKNFVSKLLSTHPPVEERVNALLGDGAYSKLKKRL